MIHRKLTVAFTLALGPLVCGTTSANETRINHAPKIEEVTVVADFRSASAQNLATSVTIIDEAAIAQSGARHFEELISGIPNLNFAGGTSRARFFQIRGIGERSQFASPINPSVGYIVDNVDFSGVGSIGTLMDVSQVEVFRGPQGTRYGANALAGLIYIKTNDPTPDQTLELNLTAGNYGNRTAGLVVNQPLTDGVSARLALEQHQSDGFYKNIFKNRDDVNERDELTARIKLSVDDIENWSIVAALSHIDVDNGYDTFSLDNNRRTRSDEPGRDLQQSDSFSLEARRPLDSAELVIIAGVSDSELEYSYDEDWTFTGFDPIGYTSFDQYLRDKKIASVEARLVSNTDSQIFSSTTDWLVGVYHLDQQEDLTRNYTFLAAPFNSEYDFKSTALFVQFDTQLSDIWQLAWGGRIEKRSTEYDNSDLIAFSPSENFWGGRIALKRLVGERSMVYASLAKGYKAGGFNTDGTLPANLREFDSEELIEWEVGVKSQLMDNRLRLEAAVFVDDRKEQQVKSSFVRARADGSTEFVDFLGNAATGTNRGIEISALWVISDNFSIDVSSALLDAEFDDFINEFGEDLSGRDQAQAPNHSYQIAFEYQRGPWSSHLTFVGQDEFFFSDRHALKSDSRSLINANLTYTGQRYTVSFWGRNLSDDDFSIRGFGSFGNDPRNGYQTSPYVQFGEPRVFGITTDINF